MFYLRNRHINWQLGTYTQNFMQGHGNLIMHNTLNHKFAEQYCFENCSLDITISIELDIVNNTLLNDTAILNECIFSVTFSYLIHMLLMSFRFVAVLFSLSHSFLLSLASETMANIAILRRWCEIFK